MAITIIDDLPALTSPQSGDELPIERGSYAYKIDYNALASAILGKIGASSLAASPSMLVNLASTSAANVMQSAPRPGVTGVLPLANGGTGVNSLEGLQGVLNMAFGLYLTSEAWSGLYTELSVIATNTTATYKCNANTTSLLTGTKVSSITFGVVSRLTSTIFEFIGGLGNSQYMYKWRVTFSSDGSSATVGTVYRFTGTAI